MHAAIVFATLAMLISSTLKLARGKLMPFLAGTAILLLLRKYMAGQLTLVSVLKYAAIFTGSIAALFVSFSMLRGMAGPDALIGDVLGYTIAAYNRLAAILDGRLRYPFSERGLYISGFVAFNNTFNNLFHVDQLLAWPDFYTVWQSEFDAVAAAGLNGQLIWSGTFGYIFSDLKWLSSAVVFHLWANHRLGMALTKVRKDSRNCALSLVRILRPVLVWDELSIRSEGGCSFSWYARARPL